MNSTYKYNLGVLLLKIVLVSSCPIVYINYQINYSRLKRNNTKHNMQNTPDEFNVRDIIDSSA
jgi:hypothetical protein